MNGLKNFKLLPALIAILLSVLLAGCGHSEESGGTVTVRVGSLKGPTSLGILFLMEKGENKETKNEYQLRMAAGAEELLPLMVKGELDIALVPA
ncbi:MAG: ABC transporter substrate-binding protein, partial [Acetatifactor sp.]|nr:ABC transporter substrate-binding protein [Acetatifactor sp.]